MGKILVTGASGFTGTHLCRRFIQENEQVIAFVRPSSQVQELKTMGVECRIVDIKDLKSVKDNFYGIEQVYHIAAAWRAEHSDDREFRFVNVEATRNLLEASKAAKTKRFVHCSTVGVQGHIDDPPANEDYRFNPGDHYQRTKMEGELLARKYFSQGLPGVVVRPAGIYGPGDIRFLKLFRSINKGIFVMIGSGKTLYHFTYIDDLVQGILLAGKKPEALGEVFTVAGEEFVALSELVKLIASVLGKPSPKWRVPFLPVYLASVLCAKMCQPLNIQPPIFPRRVEFFSKDRAFTIGKAKDILGFNPRVSLREGIAKTAAWYKEQGFI